MKKPDRWERMVNKEFGVVNHSDPIDAGVANGIYREAATKLLRQEHRWVGSMVKNTSFTVHPDGTIWVLQSAVLRKLKERAK